MYLKSLEVQGFKSFANKIVFKFHNGITGIVGPNGSGKSNVGDAVRWVLGEQSAKQLRGASMQDVIFSGTENRKPLGFASVAITLDNSDHQLPVEYQEVTVTRRVYRSGESEYLINGAACRLKDVNELFYDTGIGKEGYSIIGQGQIEKILSGKPEERRELFDEAAGIVKFKRRKATAQKKLEDEKQNLVRVNDILSELTKQLGPLERQAETARIYLKKKEQLKSLDVNMFLLDMDQIKQQLAGAEEKYSAAQEQLAATRQEYEGTKEKYDELEDKLEALAGRIEDEKERANKNELLKQQLEGQINVLTEQINTAEQNKVRLAARAGSIKKDLEEKEAQKEASMEEARGLKAELEKARAEEAVSMEEGDALTVEIDSLKEQIESAKSGIISLMNQRSAAKVRMQRYDTMLEQIQIRKAELSQKILRLRSEEMDQEESLQDLKREYDEVTAEIDSLCDRNDGYETELSDLQEKLNELNRNLDAGQQAYHRESSRLESLKNITERYDGYGNSIRRVMEQKSREPGLLGVVADIIKVEKSYEIAIETALGGSIQNIVTEDEETAKRMIDFLKRNKYGRATFLPLTSIGNKNGFTQNRALTEKGVIGLASSLSVTEQKYAGLNQYLLGRTVVVDNIDNAIALARKYQHSLRIVTLEGESLSPGGSMTGGAFKNSSNLLGRRREIEELQENVALLRKEMEQAQQEIGRVRNKRNDLRTKIVDLNEALKKKYIQQNTAKLAVSQMESRRQETSAGYEQLKKESREIENQVVDIAQQQDEIKEELDVFLEQERELQESIGERQKVLEEKRQLRMVSNQNTERLHLQLANVSQKEGFIRQNLERIKKEMDRLGGELQENEREGAQISQETVKKQSDIAEIQKTISAAVDQEGTARSLMEELLKEKETMNQSHKDFFNKREELSEQISLLDKESFRLNTQKEKLEEGKATHINYMWEEYELTPSAAAELKNEEYTNQAQLKKDINTLKAEIRALGNVNVNAIDDFRELSERHEFLSTQHDDLIKAEQALMEIIEELDAGMRSQFSEKFAQIQREFDKAFKELFGGGKGTLELVEDEDILEAGIRIVSQPPGKKLQNMMQLSGGEKALTAIALLFAIQNLKPSPFCLLDEIEAALDESNVGRYANYLHKLTKNTQFIIITHRRGTMSVADRLYGITMQEKGISALVSVNLIEDDLDK
ncbi:chromosome segregation protein SMC [Murimonas intestini]|uniref:Chromosome partition protein Smc n=1 Tax=Murimonas intestini TaxID=1337051 RepID=A0AB73T574_9FIRM|nr:chromosome segregation protein SMC [Murimonas intestini]MCR1840805.1 chromosome segregation protein SMC [Murimonas intestini]MCR1865144.1 chromosome segregation protein SMC [Murimonas intestini]MCR1883145.1 chromosome segregation protein SMC [Murimonas intestini]